MTLCRWISRKHVQVNKNSGEKKK